AVASVFDRNRRAVLERRTVQDERHSGPSFAASMRLYLSGLTRCAVALDRHNTDCRDRFRARCRIAGWPAPPSPGQASEEEVIVPMVSGVEVWRGDPLLAGACVNEERAAEPAGDDEGGASRSRCDTAAIGNLGGAEQPAGVEIPEYGQPSPRCRDTEN